MKLILWSVFAFWPKLLGLRNSLPLRLKARFCVTISIGMHDLSAFLSNCGSILIDQLQSIAIVWWRKEYGEDCASILVKSCAALTPSMVVGSTKGASKVSMFTTA